jgi:hypothetical protein
MKARTAMLLAAIALLALPVAARADRQLVPPGKSGAEQYFENVPTAAGPAAPSGNPKGLPTAGAEATPAALAALRALQRHGKDGAAAAGLAAGGAPPAAASGSGGSRAGTGTGAALSRALSGSDGLGAWFPILLVLSLLAAVAAGVLRRRGGEPAT